MENTYKTRGVVLHSFKYGDSGHIVHIYTEEFARVAYFVGGARSGRPVVGKNKVVLQPLSLVEIVGYKGSRSDLHRIREASNFGLSTGILFDVRKSAIALFIAEVVYRMVREDAPNPIFFDFLVGAIRRLDGAEEGVANFHIYFLLEMTRFLGYYPSSNYQDGCFFDITRGEFVVIKPQHPHQIDQHDSQNLSKFTSLGLEEALGVPMSRSDRVSLLNSLVSFIGYHHDSAYKIASIKILGEIF